MKDDYDVIVVGAGPAGCIAAQTAAAECDVLLIEKRQEIGSPVRCGEAVGRQELLEFLGSAADPKWIASEINAARVNAPDGTTVDFSGEMFHREDPLGYILERKIFDRELAKNAARAGADVMVRTRATGLIIEHGVVKGVTMNWLGEELAVRSRVVIGADGVESQVGRWGGINTTLKLKDIISCAQYHLDNVDVLDRTMDFYIGSQYSPGSYAWIFPKGDHAANVGLAVLGSKITDKRPVDYLNEFVADKFPDGQPVEFVVGGVPLSEGLKTMTSDGLMLVGDAARLTDQLTGEGIMEGLSSGTTAGTVACKAVQQKDASMKVLREYETEYNGNYFGRQRKFAHRAKELFVHRSDEELNRMVRAVHDIRVEEVTMKGIIIRLLKNDPKLLLMIRHLL
ncbi:MAG: NAD(P)/FAD-dependent oxidoreductase [Halobacteriota archaeon]|jgi:digeranylgeranylglycerophospholipid reductase